MHVSDAYVCGISRRNSFKGERGGGGGGGGSVKPQKILIFKKKGKTVISVENQKFSRSRITKRTVPLNSSREI